MSVPAKLGAFGVLLVVVFVATFSIGAVVGPLDGGTTAPMTEMPMTEMPMDDMQRDGGGG